MGRIINPDNAGKERIHLSKTILLTIRELALQTNTGNEARDMASFITLALHAIYETIDVTVNAWEKRGYWVKADKFRMEWQWTDLMSGQMRQAVLNDDWQSIAIIIGKISQKLSKIKIPQTRKPDHIWFGSWTELMKQENNTR